MTRFAKLSAVGAIAVLAGLVSTGAAFVGCEEDAPTTRALPATEVPSTPVPDGVRVFDTQHSRIFNAQVAAQKRAMKEARDKRGLRPESSSANFTLTTGGPVVGSVAIYGASFTSESQTDLMFFGTQGGSGSTGVTGGTTCSGCSTKNFFAFDKIHNDAGTGPTLVWDKSITGGVSASAAMSADGSKIYVLGDPSSGTSTLYCLVASSGAACTGWTNSTLTVTGTTAITPWVDSANNAIYVNDGGGNLYRFNATSGGAKVWEFTYASGSGSKSWPLESDLIIYIGDGSGNLYRIVDTTSGSTAPTSTGLAVTAINGSCSSGTNASIDNSVSLDTTSNLVFLPFQGCLFSFPHFCSTTCTVTTGTWATSLAKSVFSSSVPATTLQSWAALDGTYAYWVIPGSTGNEPSNATPVSGVWKETYALTGTIEGTLLQNASSSAGGASVGSAPVVNNGVLFVGDSTGYVQEFGCASSKSASTAFLAETSQAAGAVNTPIVFDDLSGNIEYGFSNGVAQYPLFEGTTTTSFNWNCPSGMVACANQLCGTGSGTASIACVPTAECSSGNACTTVQDAGGTVQVGVAETEGLNVTGIYTAGGGTQDDAGANICPPGYVVQGILGASYGTAPQSPDFPVSGNTFDFSTTCQATDSLSVSGSSCALNNSVNCVADGGAAFIGENATFGDPCEGTLKHYYGWFACSPKITDGGTVPTFCSRQNVQPNSGASDPCAANPDGGGAVCQGTCVGVWGDCNNNLQYDGCETNIFGTDPSNCGHCGTTCSAPTNATASCTAGSCSYACNSGYTACAGGCIATSDFQTDAYNCGSCGNTCVGGGTCTAGVCGAPSGSCTKATGLIYTANTGGAETAAVVGTVTNPDGGAALICPSGTVVQAVVGASFGTPPAADNTAGTTFSFSTTCAAEDSLSLTEANCTMNDEQNCTFTSGNGTFGTGSPAYDYDPCYLTAKYYYGWFVCAAEQASGSLPYYCSRQNVTPPDGGTDPCITNPDGGASFCSGACMAGFKDCNNDLQSDGCESDSTVDPLNCGGCAGLGGVNCTTLDGGVNPYCGGSRTANGATPFYPGVCTPYEN